MHGFGLTAGQILISSNFGQILISFTFGQILISFTFGQNFDQFQFEEALAPARARRPGARRQSELDHFSF